MIIAYSATWAISAAQGSWQTASKAKTGLLVAIGGACPPRRRADVVELAPRSWCELVARKRSPRSRPEPPFAPDAHPYAESFPANLRALFDSVGP